MEQDIRLAMLREELKSLIANIAHTSAVAAISGNPYRAQLDRIIDIEIMAQCLLVVRSEIRGYLAAKPELIEQ